MLRLLCLTAGLIVLCWGASWTVAEWQFRAGLKKAKADMDAKRFATAGRWLAGQWFIRLCMVGWPGYQQSNNANAQWVYDLLGYCNRRW